MLSICRDLQFNNLSLLPQVCLSLAIVSPSFSLRHSLDRNQNLVEFVQVAPSASFHLLSFIINITPSTNHTGLGSA
jgi:hypothetical protein